MSLLLITVIKNMKNTYMKKMYKILYLLTFNSLHISRIIFITMLYIVTLALTRTKTENIFWHIIGILKSLHFDSIIGMCPTAGERPPRSPFKPLYMRDRYLTMFAPHYTHNSIIPHYTYYTPNCSYPATNIITTYA